MSRLIPLFLTVASIGSSMISGVAAKAPEEPSNLQVRVLGINAFELTWKDNSKTELGWEIKAALKGTEPSRYALVPTVNLNRYVVITNELPGKDLVFQVRAYNGTAGFEKFSKNTSIVTVTTPAQKKFAAPIDLVASPVNDGTIRLKWKDRANSESGYQMEFKGALDAEWVSLGTTGPNTFFSIPASGFSPATPYSFRVRAFIANPLEFSKYTNVASASTTDFAGPEGLIVTPESDGAFSFKWKDKSSIEAGFEVERKTGEGEFTSLGTVGANSTDIDPVPGFDLRKIYQFRVRAFRMVGVEKLFSPYSSVVSATSTSLLKPAEILASGASDSSITVTWDDRSTRENGYEVKYRPVGTEEFLTASIAGNLETYTIPGLEPGALYEIRVNAVVKNFFGVVTARSAFIKTEARSKDGIAGNFNPPIFFGTSFNYPILLSRASQLDTLAVTGLPAGLVFDQTERKISGTASVDGVKLVTLQAKFLNGSTITKTLTLRIVRPAAAPLIASPFPPIQTAVGATASAPVTGRFSDPDTQSAARFSSAFGNVDIILYSIATPATVTNFLNYIDAGQYDNMFYHRSKADLAGNLFIVQGGGYRYKQADGFSRVTKSATVNNEPGISNLQGTVAMAKVGGNPNSATSEFFYNLNDLNATNLDTQNGGFTVFGRVSQPSFQVIQNMNALTTKDYSVLIGTAAQSIEDVPITSPSTASQIDPSRLVLVTSADAAPILTYSVVSRDPAIATAVATATTIEITGTGSGTTIVDVTATDLDGSVVSQQIQVSVP